MHELALYILLVRQHRQLNAEDQRLAGVTSDLIRLSVGIEDVSDIIADLEAALVGGKTHANHN